MTRLRLTAYPVEFRNEGALQWLNRMRRRVETAPDGLIDIHHRPRHQAGFVACEERHGTSGFRWIDQTAERLRGAGLCEPVVGRAVIRALDPVFTGGRHPAQIQSVHANAVAQQRVGGVLCQRCERAFRGAVRRDERLPGKRRHRAHVDDGAFGSLAAHDFDHTLHEKERRTHVSREDAIEKLGGRVENRPAIGRRRRVDERVDTC